MSQFNMRNGSDIKFSIVKHLNDVDDFKSLILVDKSWNTYWKNNKEYVSKLLLQAMEVEINDKSNFIYVMNDVDYNEEMTYYSKLKLYSKFNNDTEIDCALHGITSIPRYPKVIILSCSDNDLEYIPPMESLEELYCYYNKIKTLSKMDNLKILHCYKNLIKIMPKYKKLKELISYNNLIKSIPTMKYLRKVVL